MKQTCLEQSRPRRPATPTLPSHTHHGTGDSVSWLLTQAAHSPSYTPAIDRCVVNHPAVLWQGRHTRIPARREPSSAKHLRDHLRSSQVDSLQEPCPLPIPHSFARPHPHQTKPANMHNYVSQIGDPRGQFVLLLREQRVQQSQLNATPSWKRATRHQGRKTHMHVEGLIKH